MKNNISDLVHDVVASPLGDVIAAVAEGVAEAQQALDEGSLAQTLDIYAEGGDEALRVLREIGYRPTFYALPETTGELNIAMHLGSKLSPTQTLTQSNNAKSVALQAVVMKQLSKTGRNLQVKPRVYATPVDAGYANRYGFNANISAKLSFKIVPVPAPDGADEVRILPTFLGSSIQENRILADSLGLELRIVNSSNELIENPDEKAIVSAQEPAIDPLKPQLIRLGEEVILTIA
jgi:hypothetical protein